MLFVLFASFARSAFAQPATPAEVEILPPAPTSPSAADVATAKKRADNGARLMRMRLFEAARGEYLAAYATGGRPADLQGAAQARRELGEGAEAYATYQAVLARHATQLSAFEKNELQRQLDALDAMTGLVEVRSNESRATVILGERAIGVTPLSEPVRVSVGTRVITLVKRGFEPFQAVVSVASKQRVTVDANLSPVATKGRLAVREKNGGEAHVFVDDQDKGAAPWEGELLAGPHAVALKGPKLSAAPQSVHVPLKQRVEVVLEATALVGRLRVRVVPAAALISIDEKEVGSGKWEGDLPVGPHRVVARAKGFKTRENAVELEAGKERELSVELEKVATAKPAEISKEVLELRRSAEYAGLYADLSLFGGVGITHAEPDCPVGNGCDFGGTYAGGAMLRLGYSFGIPGFHFVGAFLGGRQVNTFTSQVSFNEQQTISSLGAFGGIGLRLMSHGDLVRAAFGVSGGVLYRSYKVTRDLSNGASDLFDSPTTDYIAPGALVDLGLTIGSTPGVRVVIGVLAALDFNTSKASVNPVARSLNVGGAPTNVQFPATTVTSGFNAYVGPMLGIQFGR